MKSLIKFIKTTVFGGLVVVIPIAVITIVMADFFKTLVAVTAPLTAKMPFGVFVNTILAIVVVVLFILSIFFIAGLLFNTFWGRSAKNWLEDSFLERIPMYSTLKDLTKRVIGIENSNFPVVEIDVYGSGVSILGVVVEEIADGRLMVYTPLSPLVSVGQLYVVTKDRVKELDASIPDVINCLSKMGLEADKIFQGKGIK